MFSVIIPALNEPDLRAFIYRVHEAVEGIPHEVLVAQGDREKQLRFVPIEPNERLIWSYGDSLERSILNGFSQALGNRIAVMDADGSHPPEMLPAMWRGLEDYEMVVGSRFIEGSKFKTEVKRDLVTTLCCMFAYDVGSKLRDPMSGFFAIRREVLDRCIFKPLTWKTCLEIELMARPKLIEIPIEFREREGGLSKTSIETGFRLIWQLRQGAWN